MDRAAISVVGLGYIGLPTAAVLAECGEMVVGYDVNPEVVATINSGSVHIVEPGLEELVRDMVTQGRLRASTEPAPADAFLIAVPTPFKNAFEPDLRFVHAAVLSIAPLLKQGDVVILESTSPVGSTELMAQWLGEARPDLAIPRPEAPDAVGDIALAYCPERVIPGKTLGELRNNDRVIGGLTPRCAERAREIYAKFVDGECILTDARTAELCKLSENSFRDVNIAFANELSLICDEMGIDVFELIALANRHPRVSILQPGPGVGGHCIAVDPWFIVHSSPRTAKLIRTGREVNDAKPGWVVRRVSDAVAARAANQERPVRVACFGLTFKADIDDMRESPALQIALELARNSDSELVVVEPNISVLPAGLAERAELVDAQNALDTADVIVLLVDHSSFRSCRPDLRADQLVIDTKGVWSGRMRALSPAGG